MSEQKKQHDCTLSAPVSRLAFIVDSAHYFRAVYEALRHARRSVFVLGWDIDSRTRLVHDEESADRPSRLGPLLQSMVEANPRLCIHLLIWDYSTFYLPDREVLAPLRLGWQTSGRLRFSYDSHHPSGASHHQKIIVVDDSIAFLGGDGSDDPPLGSTRPRAP